MADLRESVLIPTIKCSSCGDQVEIAMLGDHVCGSGKSTAPEPPPPPPDPRNGGFSSLKNNMFNKFARTTPTVDTSAANRAFARLDQLPPGNTPKYPPAFTPRTPMGMQPGTRSSNNDTWPVVPISPRPPVNHGESAGDSEFLEAEPTNRTSPNIQTSRVLSRMDNIIPGPFEVSRTHSPRNPTFPKDVEDDPSEAHDAPACLRSSFEWPGTSGSGAGRIGSLALPEVSGNNGYGSFPPRPKQGDELGFPYPGFNKRAETFPDKLASRDRDPLPTEASIRPPSDPGLRPERPPPPTNHNGDSFLPGSERRPSYGIRDTSRPPPPRTSLIRPQTRDGSRNISIDLASEFGAGNPYHSPSTSQSSADSTYSQESPASDPSSNTSPARSVGSRSGSRKTSVATGVDSLIEDLEKSMNIMQPRPAPAPPSVPAALSVPTAPITPAALSVPTAPLAPATQATPAAPAALAGPPVPAALAAPTAPQKPKVMIPDCLKPGTARGGPIHSLRLDSPTLAGQNGQEGQDGQTELPESPTIPENVTNSIDATLEEAKEAKDEVKDETKGEEKAEGEAEVEGEGRKRSQTVTSTGSATKDAQPSEKPRIRGTCKGCQEPITGKSVSSADGRLTGRYHKACFVCFTCKEAFASATFYVHEDQPYCEQHYHKLNGSLCGACNRGIEGQYLEDEVPRKYHPGCFRCGDCGLVLLDGYFDVNGRSYCEIDAWRRLQAATRTQPMGPPPPPQQYHGPAYRPGMRPPPPPGGMPGPHGPYRGPPPGHPGNLHRPFGVPNGQRLMPGQALGRNGLGPMHKLERRMTRLGMM